jgi:hypothetical protein
MAVSAFGAALSGAPVADFMLERLTLGVGWLRRAIVELPRFVVHGLCKFSGCDEGPPDFGPAGR